MSNTPGVKATFTRLSNLLDLMVHGMPKVQVGILGTLLS